MAHNGHEKQADTTEDMELGDAVGGSTAGVWQNTERYLTHRKPTLVKLRMVVGEYGTMRNTGVEYPARCSMVSSFEKCLDHAEAIVCTCLPKASSDPDMEGGRVRPNRKARYRKHTAKHR